MSLEWAPKRDPLSFRAFDVSVQHSRRFESGDTHEVALLRSVPASPWARAAFSGAFGGIRRDAVYMLGSSIHYSV